MSHGNVADPLPPGGVAEAGQKGRRKQWDPKVAVRTLTPLRGGLRQPCETGEDTGLGLLSEHSPRCEGD